MKLLTGVLLSALAMAAQPQPSKPSSTPPETKPEDLCSVAGQVTSVATGAPVRKAEISLRGMQRVTAGTMPASYTATADAGGNFFFKDVQPGKYRLSVQRTGFVTLQYGARGPNRSGTALSLSPGQRLKDLSLRLLPQAVIAGRIVDENNDPIVSAWVRTMRYSYAMGKKQLIPTGNASTNDLGEYRISGLAPGRYYLAATEKDEDWEATVDASATPAAENYVSTYYPGTIDTTTAALIDVEPGAQLRAVNITLAKARTVRIRGRVEGRRDASVSFFKRNQDWWSSAGQQEHATGQNGSFEIDGVLPGGYTITATAWSGSKSVSARRDVDVGESNIDDLVLVMAAGTTLAGHVDVASGTPPDLSSVRVFLQPQEGRLVMGPLTDQVHDGDFSVADLSPDIYRLQVSGLPGGYWVKSMRMGDQDVKLHGVDLTHGPGDAVTIIIAPNAGQIDGAAINEKQQPAAGAIVVLVPEPGLREAPDAYKSTASDEKGRFSFENIEPGDYKLFAWEDVEYGAYMDPDFLRPLEDRGQSISIQESSHETAQVTVIPSDSAPAAQKDK